MSGRKVRGYMLALSERPGHRRFIEWMGRLKRYAAEKAATMNESREKYGIPGTISVVAVIVEVDRAAAGKGKA